MLLDAKDGSPPPLLLCDTRIQLHLCGLPVCPLPYSLSLFLLGSLTSLGTSLAPENPYPAAYDDAHRAWNYITSSAGASKLHVNKARVAIYGSSAGAALATGLSIRLNKEKEGVKPKIVVCDS